MKSRHRTRMSHQFAKTDVFVSKNLLAPGHHHGHLEPEVQIGMETSMLVWALAGVALVLGTIGLLNWHLLFALVQLMVAGVTVMYLRRLVLRRRLARSRR